MSHLRTKILKTAVILSLMTGGVIAMKSQGFDAVAASHKAIQTIETKSENLAAWTGAKVDPIRKGWQRLDANAKVRDFQHKTKPIGQKIKSSVTVDKVPGANAALWTERNMSLPAMLLILVFGGILAVMKMSGPTSRLGGRH